MGIARVAGIETQNLQCQTLPQARKLRTFLGRVIRDVERKVGVEAQKRKGLQRLLQITQRLHDQPRKRAEEDAMNTLLCDACRAQPAQDSEQAAASLCTLRYRVAGFTGAVADHAPTTTTSHRLKSELLKDTNIAFSQCHIKTQRCSQRIVEADRGAESARNQTA